MNSIAFTPLVDLPLAGVLLAGLSVNSWLWAKSDRDESEVDLEARLPTALIRLTLFFFGLVIFCWLTNVGVWVIAAAMMVSGIAISVFAGSNSFVPELMLVATAGMLREWTFGFPNLILSPRVRSPSSKDTIKHELVGVSGVTTSPLRTTGDIRIDSEELSAISDNGTLIEKGTEVVVVAVKNGRMRVRAANSRPTNGG